MATSSSATSHEQGMLLQDVPLAGVRGRHSRPTPITSLFIFFHLFSVGGIAPIVVPCNYVQFTYANVPGAFIKGLRNVMTLSGCVFSDFLGVPK